MKQVCLAEGEIRVVDVPPPVPAAGQVLVRTAYSLISTGTELAATKTSGGTLALVRHAIANPALVRKVWDRVGAVGIRQTAELVRARQHSMVPLGYSAAGTVIGTGPGVMQFREGDRVACAGAGFANHADVIAVPVNLVALVPDAVPLEHAAFATVGAIALHGVRRAEPTLGERVVVIGLGLIGQITIQLLRAHGARVFGVDLREDRIAQGRARGLESGISPAAGRTLDAVMDWSGGIGADAVIVCASSGNAALLNESFDLCRRRGRVVLVGDVPIRVARDRIYRKELDFRISTSYGPGRYDSAYEEKGQDYPIGYVRWTEGRNLAEVLRLAAAGELDLASLSASIHPVDLAAEAYARLSAGDAPIAALLKYDADSAASARRTIDLPVRAAKKTGDVVLGVIGAGAFFRGVHLPTLQKHGGFFIKTIASRSGLSARDSASRAGVPHVASGADEILQDPEIDAVLIATRHDLHARLVEAAAAAGKHVFVEKPLALTTADAQRARDAAAAASVLVSVGFNRRFSPLARAAKDAAQRVGRSKTVIYRINAGQLPPEHWLLDPAQGGGRLRGEGVHFLDWVRWVVDSEATAVSGRALRTGDGLDQNTMSVTVEFADGSLASVMYCGEGAARSGKERIEIYGGNQSIVLDDFQKLDVYTGGAHAADHRKHVEKGHFEILDNFYRAIRGDAALGVTADDGLAATRMAEEALRTSMAEP